MITRRPWFGPKRIGWGWRPVSWQGWAATAVSLAVVCAAYASLGPGLAAIVVSIVSVLVLFVICLLTGTPPG